jgi:hypothetical protein
VLQALPVAAAQAPLDVSEVASTLDGQLRPEVVMGERARVACARCKAMMKSLPEAVKACAQVIDDLGGQTPSGRAVKVLILYCEALHDPE